jgi:hypothetical protein
MRDCSFDKGVKLSGDAPLLSGTIDEKKDPHMAKKPNDPTKSFEDVFRAELKDISERRLAMGRATASEHIEGPST